MGRDLKAEALKLHRDYLGKIAVRSKVELRDAWDLSLAYSPGVAEPCLAIADSPTLSTVPQEGIWSPSSLTGRQCSDWATSAQELRCR